jgi:hypothetical protein
MKNLAHSVGYELVLIKTQSES